MQKLRTEKGITLIALIITIIVMLILVGVTVSVSLNGGLFTTAKEATNKTQVELDKEQLLELALGTIGRDGKVDKNKLEQAVDGKFTVTGEEDKIYTSKSGNKFTINDWGSVTQIQELSGKWRFVDTPQPQTADKEGIYLSQEIAFMADGYITDDYGEEVLEKVTYDEIVVSYGKDQEYHTHYSLWIVYESRNFSSSAAYRYIEWDTEAHGPGNNPDYQSIDFGTTPQPVSQEFYEWFTANANPVV